MKRKATSTAGKRTARPGTREADAMGRARSKWGRGLSTAGAKSARGLTKNIAAHQRAAGQRSHNPKGK